MIDVFIEPQKKKNIDVFIEPQKKKSFDICSFDRIIKEKGEPDKDGSQTAIFDELYKISDFLYSAQYNGIDEDWGLKYCKEQNGNISIGTGGCSGVRKGKYWGRNFDWLYDNRASFVIQVSPTINHFGYLGVTSSSSITKQLAEKVSSTTETLTKEEINYFRVLPLFTQTGENEKGVFIQVNITPLREGEDITVYRENAEAEICERNVVYYILSHAESAEDAIDLLQNRLSIYPSIELSAEHRYKSHYLFGDSEHTYVAEFVNGDIEIYEKSYMTNFGFDGVTFPDDDIIPTPGIGHATDIGIYEYGAGLERWNLIVNKYSELTDKDSMRELMNDLMYSHAYTIRENPNDIWYTEFVNDNLTVDSPREDFSQILELSERAWEQRDRNNPLVWNTSYSIVFDLEEKTMFIISQEDIDNEYVFSLKTKTGMEWENIENKPFESIGLHLLVENGKLKIDTSTTVEEDNTRPVTSAAVYAEIGNIDSILQSI